MSPSPLAVPGDTDPDSSPRAAAGTTYARARLRLGITGVGLLVVVSSALLIAGAPATLLHDVGGTPLGDLGALSGLLAVFCLAMLPLDLCGGWLLPGRFGRPRPTLPVFLARWGQGVGVQLVALSACGAAVIAAGRLGGLPAALGAVLVLQLLLLRFQEPLARWIGGLRRAPLDPERGRRLPDVVVLAGDDPGFTGGISGLPGRFGGERLVLPASWLQRFDDATLESLVARRRAIVSRGLRARGLVAAVLFNLVGFAAASLLPGAGVTSVAELVTTALGFCLWSFLGLLVLPTPSRRATVAADGLVGRDGKGGARLAAAFRELDRLQDDEPRRGRWIERVFHPVPAVEHRLAEAHSSRGDEAWGAWHVARTALYLSQAGLGLLSRAVHCNAGRPELWVFLPSDG